MKTPTLAPVYLDNEPVSLMGDPRPQVSKVVAATGKHPEKFEIKLLESENASEGKLLGLDDVIDRTEEPTKAIYLTAVEREGGDELAAEGAQGVPGKSGSGFGSRGGSPGGPSLGKGSSGTWGGQSPGIGDAGSSGGPSSQWSGKSGTTQGGSAQGNQGYGSASGKTQNQGTSTQDQGSFGQGKGGSREPKGGAGTSSQGKTQTLGSQEKGSQEKNWPVPGTSDKPDADEDLE